MGRSPCCEKMGLKKGPWTPDEDQILVNYIQLHGHSNWRALPKFAGLLRCGKSCRLRWINYLRPDIKRGNFTADEEETILKLHELLGNRWSAIAAKLPGRTDNEIKNIWHTHLKKRVLNPNPNPKTDTSPVLSKKRVRKSRVGKTGEISKKLKLEQNYYYNNNNDNKNNENEAEAEYGEGPTRSLQECVSTSEMSTVTTTSSTSASENDKRGKEIVEGYFGEFTEINEDFWLEVLSVEDTAMSNDQGPFPPSITKCNSDSDTLSDHIITEPIIKLESKVDGDDMDFFWHNLLTRTSSELPEFSEIAL